MPHYHTEGFENAWALVRETPSSQKWNVETPEGVRVAVDIHYTPASVLTVNIVSEGPTSKSILTPIMDDIGELGIYRGDYAVIDYTLAETSEISDGNYSVSDGGRKFRRL